MEENKQIHNTRTSFRLSLEELMKADRLDDFDLEEIESGIYYSRGVRTLCVLDPRFEEQIDLIEKEFDAERRDTSPILRQVYTTLYGRVIVAQKNNDTVISLSDNDSAVANRKGGKH